MNKRRWLPPVPDEDALGMPRSLDSDVVDLSKNDQKNVLITKFFMHPPKNDSFAKELAGEDVVEVEVGKTAEDEEVDEEKPEMTPKEKILSEVWDDKFPVMLYMRKEPSLVEKAKAIGCFDKGDTQEIIKYKVMEYHCKR